MPPIMAISALANRAIASTPRGYCHLLFWEADQQL